jgi:hypothetical protein
MSTTSKHEDPSLYINALTTALHNGDYRPVSALAHQLYKKSGQRGSIEKYIQYRFPEELCRIISKDSKHVLEYFLVELYKASVRNIIIGHIIHIVHVS